MKSERKSLGGSFVEFEMLFESEIFSGSVVLEFEIVSSIVLEFKFFPAFIRIYKK